MLAAADIAALLAHGVDHVTGARLEAGDTDEDSAARIIAALFENGDIVARAPHTGRCNLYARAPGLLLADSAGIDRLNRISEHITLATLAPYAPARKDQRVATVKIIPFAVKEETLAQWRAQAEGPPLLRLAPLRPRRAALIQSLSPGADERLLDTARDVTRARLDALGGALALELRCAHDAPQLADAIAQARAAGCDLLLIAGATVSKDRADVVPAAILAAGGVIEHFGMPVEPGNMLLYARIGQTPVLNLPGCSRSPAHNGLDILLRRIYAGLPVTSHTIMGLGVGGLLRARNQDGDTADAAADAGTTTEEDTAAAPPPARIAVLLLAAGRSTRMGGQNKLLCHVDGVPLVRRAANAACASRACQVMLVSGHDAEQVEAQLTDRPVSIVYNPDYATGMASSLRRGLRALPADLDAVIVMLADMPGISAEDVDRLIAAFDPARPGVLVPEHDGRRGNPVLWPRRHFAEMMAISGDTGARGLLEQYAADVRCVPFPDAAIFADIDTPAALEHWTARP